MQGAPLLRAGDRSAGDTERQQLRGRGHAKLGTEQRQDLGLVDHTRPGRRRSAGRKLRYNIRVAGGANAV